MIDARGIINFSILLITPNPFITLNYVKKLGIKPSAGTLRREICNIKVKLVLEEEKHIESLVRGVNMICQAFFQTAVYQ